ncbi:unannotated protein [freshwater metagenome]|uniref:Unannotated protein n=1 Tax=freshwater metagenome TaxID=449393 RepID=A0A6J7EVX4_9ZZZZ
MDADEYQRIAASSERHWWYRSTRSLLRQLIEPHIVHSPDAICLDAAGGTGATGAWLRTHATTILADYDDTALHLARAATPDYRPVRADLNHLPFADDAFSVVLCVTALYHRMNPDPAAVVRDFARITRPGGLVCLMEPAGKRLWRSHDEVTHAARRFSLGELRHIAEAAGLEIVTATGAYSFLLPPAFVMSLIERRRTAQHSATAASSDVERSPSGLGGVLSALAAIERRLLRHVSLPFGLSALVIARKPVDALPFTS